MVAAFYILLIAGHLGQTAPGAKLAYREPAKGFFSCI